MKRKILLSAFAAGISLAVATQIKAHARVNNRRDATCTPIVGDCNSSGSNTCLTTQYDINDTNCQTKLTKRP